VLARYDVRMNFLAIFIALLLEQARPLGPGNAPHRVARAWAAWAQKTLDAGQTPQAWLAWSLAAAVPAVLSALVYHLLGQVSVLLALLWMVCVLYLTLGFRQFSHHFSVIRDALGGGDDAEARAELARWKQVDATLLPRAELLRQVIEYAVIAAHRHVLGVLFCFVLLAVFGLGPAGAVLYRMSELLSRQWLGGQSGAFAPSQELKAVSARAWHGVDFLPVRVTGLAFAVVGNFEEAVAAWRQDASRFPNPNDGIVLAATSGAIDVRLVSGANAPTEPQGEDLDSMAREPQLGHLASVVGLVWRAVVLWLLVLVLMLLARLVG
jgi:adenosylcobinamide-phosphate synthase